MVSPASRFRRLFAFDIKAQLRDPRGQRLDRLNRPRLPLIQRVALHLQALQDSRRNRLFLAQRRQSGLTVFAGLRRNPRQPLGLARRLHPLGQRQIRSRPCILGLAPAPVQQQPLGMPQLGPDLAVPRRLPAPAVPAASTAQPTARPRHRRGQGWSRLPSASTRPRAAAGKGPEIPAASSRYPPPRLGPRIDQFAEICPCRTNAGECAPVEASANSICTSRARTSLVLTL